MKLTYIMDGKKYDAKYEFSSMFSDFYGNGKYLIKVRKRYCSVFGVTSPKEAKYQTSLEYYRGRVFEPDVYGAIVDCIGAANSTGLLMKRLPEDSRLDNQIRKKEFDKKINRLIYNRIQKLCEQASSIYQLDYYCNLQNGNTRLLNCISYRREADWLLAQWELIINDTIRLRDELYSRVKKGYVKELHGDLTMTNLYFDLDKNRIIILDPCVASKDMYQIDTLYEFADYLSELICYGCFEEYKNCIDMLMQSDWYSEELFRFYAHRYCLIRATIHFMASNLEFVKYKQGAEYINEYFNKS